MSDRKLIDLNDKWSLMADSLQWIVARRSGDIYQGKKFIRGKGSIISLVNAKPKTDTLNIGGITDEAWEFINNLPETYTQWAQNNPGKAISGRGRPKIGEKRENDANKPTEDIPMEDINIFAAKPKFRDGIVIISCAIRQEDGSLMRKDIKVKALSSPDLEGSDVRTISAKTRQAWIRKKEKEGLIVMGVKNFNHLDIEE